MHDLRLPVGGRKQIITAGRILVLYRARRNDYSLRMNGFQRVRWGTLHQIRQDINHVTQTGYFPPQKQGWA